MQSKTSCFNGVIFRKNITYFWPIWVIYTAVLIFMIPVRLFLNTYVESSYTMDQIKEMRTGSYMSLLSNSINAPICFVVSVVSVMAVFYFLYSNRSAHAYHSFPVRREELFLTNYFSGFLFYTVPLLVTFLLGVLVCTLRGITALEYLLAWFLLMEGMNFFLYNMTIFAGMFTGQLFAVPVLSLIANFLYVGCRYIVTSILGIIGYGLSDIYAERSVSIFSPLYFMMNKVGIEGNWNGEITVYSVQGYKFVAAYTVVGFLFGIAAFFIYRKRQLETTGDMCSVSFIKPIFRWGLAAFASMLLAMIISNVVTIQLSPAGKFTLVLVCTLVFGFLFFFAAEMILQKKTRIFSRKRFAECGIYSVLMILFFFCMEANLFGMENKLPDEADIASAKIQMYYPIYMSDAEGIEEVLAIHQQIIDSKKEFESFDTKENSKNTRYVQIRYILKDGTPFYRNYTIPGDDSSFADDRSVVSQIRTMSCDPDNYIGGNICRNLEDTEITSMDIDVYDDNLVYNRVSISEEDYPLVIEAIRKDAESGSLLMDSTDYEENSDYIYWNSINIGLYSKNGVQTVWTDYYSYDTSDTDSAGITFNKSCKNLVQVLRDIGVVNDTNQRLITGKEYDKMAEENGQ